jgi:hypothetical protein
MIKNNKSPLWRTLIVWAYCSILQYSAIAQIPNPYQPTWVISSSCGTATPKLEQVLIDACGIEGKSEYIVFRTGSSPFNPSNLSLQGSSFNVVNGQNVYVLASNFVNSHLLAAKLNSYVGTCASYPFLSANGTMIPPNAKVIAFPYPWQTQTPIDFGYTPILTNLCNTEPIYVITGNWNNTAGFYANALTQNGVQIPCTSNCVRTLKVSFGGSCIVDASYHRDNLARIDGCNIKPDPTQVGKAQIDGSGNLCFPMPSLNPACAGLTISAAVTYDNMYATITATTNVANPIFEWKDPDDNLIQGADTITDIVRPGIYTVIVTDFKGCKKTMTIKVEDKHCR